MQNKVYVSFDSGKSFLKDTSRLHIEDLKKCNRPLFVYNNIDYKKNDIVTIIADARDGIYYLNYMCINDKIRCYNYLL